MIVKKKELKWSAIPDEAFKLTVLAAGTAEACGAVTKLAGSLPTVAPVEANAIAAHRWNIKKKKIKKKEINNTNSSAFKKRSPLSHSVWKRYPKTTLRVSQQFNLFHERRQHRCSRVTHRIKSRILQGHCGSSLSQKHKSFKIKTLKMLKFKESRIRQWCVCVCVQLDSRRVSPPLSCGAARINQCTVHVCRSLHRSIASAFSWQPHR